MIAASSPIAPRSNGRTAFATCVGCRDTRLLDGATRLCADCTELVERDKPAYCVACGLPVDSEHAVCERARSHIEATYCAVDGWWLGTHPRCQGRSA